MMPFMSKKKKYRFQVHLGLEELTSVPFVSGIIFAKIRLHEGGSFSDLSSREEVHNNTVSWSSQFEFPCKMTASMSSGVLDPCLLRISVRREVKGGKSHQKLGYVDLNLSQFAGGGRITRRSLLEGYDGRTLNSVINRQDNSLLKVSVEMSLISGDPVFKVPSNHVVTQSCSVTSQPLDPIDLRPPTDNHSEDSLASSSSGFSSLTRRGKLSSQISDGCELDQTDQGLGHSRSASYASQHSKGSGYGNSIFYCHSRASSNGSEHSFVASGGSGGGGGGHNRTPSSVSSTLERRRKMEESGKEVVVGATRVDAEALVRELIESTDLNSTEVDESSGLQLLVQKDGSMALR